MRGTRQARPVARRRLHAATVVLLLASLALAPGALAGFELRTLVGATGPSFPASGGFAGDGGSARLARISRPTQVARLPGGGFLFTDSGNARVRRVGPDGRIATVAGNGSQGYCGDGGPAVRACLNVPHGVVAGPQGSIYIADTFNQRIRRVGRDGRITTVAGTGVACDRLHGSCGEGGPATRAGLNLPVSVNPYRGGILIGDSATHRVLLLTRGGLLVRVAGVGRPGLSGDGGRATAARLDTVADAIAYREGFLIADGLNCRVRYVDGAGSIHTFAGASSSSECHAWAARFANPLPAQVIGDGGPATLARIMIPGYLGVAGGDVYVVDFLGNRVRRIRAGAIATVAGDGRPAGFGDPATRDARRTRLAWPSGVVALGRRVLLIADSGNNRIRRLTPDGARAARRA